MNKNESKWSCSACTYDNYQASTKCSVCLHPRGSEVIKLPPANAEKQLVINDIDSSSLTKPYSDFIICPPSCSSKVDGEDNVPTISTCESELSKNILNADDEATSDSLNNSSVLWTCPTCSFTNSRNDSRCSQCLSLKSSDNATSESSQEACFSKSSNDKSDKWSCNICTYENWNASKKCVMCLNRKGSVANSPARNPVENSVKVEKSSIPTSSRLPVENVEHHSSKNKNIASNQKPNQTTTSNYDIATRSTDPVIEGYNTRRTKSRSPSLSSNSSHSSSDDNRVQGSTNQTRSRQRRKKDYQVMYCWYKLLGAYFYSSTMVLIKKVFFF